MRDPNEDVGANDPGHDPEQLPIGASLWLAAADDLDDDEDWADDDSAAEDVCSGDVRAAGRTMTGRRLRALRRAVVEADGCVPTEEVMYRMGRAARRDGERSPMWMEHVTLVAAASAGFVESATVDGTRFLVPGPTFWENGRDITLEHPGASQYVGVLALRNGLHALGVWTGLRCDDGLVGEGLLRWLGVVREGDVAEAGAILAEDVAKAGCVDPADACRLAGNLVRCTNVVLEELGWIDITDVRTPGYPCERITRLGDEGLLLAFVTLSDGRPAWLDELAVEHGRLPAADGYIHLADLPVDISSN